MPRSKHYSASWFSVASCFLILCAMAAALEGHGQQAKTDSIQQADTDSITVKRLGHGPLITVNSSATLAGNVNGPVLIRVPDWIKKPLGNYYLYFANHKGKFIRLAYADAITGPWKIYEPGVLRVEETAFTRPDTATDTAAL